MRLGLLAMNSSINFGLPGAIAADRTLEVVKHAERLGYDSVWTAEASGTDAVAPLAWLAAHTSTIKLGTAIMQLTARVPSVTAMTAATIDQLSGYRFILGLGVSGPAVVEGWHGTPYGRPLTRTREYVGLVRDILAQQPIDHAGPYYDVPNVGPDTTGLAAPIKLMFKPRRADIPIYLAAIGAKNVALAYDIADGIIPAYYSPYREQTFFEAVSPSALQRPMEIAPFVPISMGPDVQKCRNRLKLTLAFWVGGMGAKGVNFYNDLVKRLGYEEAAAEIEQCYAIGKPARAAAAVPDALVDEITLCGPRERIAEQLDVWKKSSVTTLIVRDADLEAVTTVAELVL